LKIKIIFFLISIYFFKSNAQTPSFNFQKLGSEEGLNSANIFNIEQHPNGLIYFTTSNGVYYYDGYGFNKLEMDSLKNNALLNVVLKNEDELYLSIREEGLATYNLKSKLYNRQSNLTFKNNSDNFIITKKFAYFLTSEIKLITIDLKTGLMIEDEWKKKDLLNVTNCIFKTKAGRVLVGRRDGLYDATEGKQKKINYIQNTKINSIAETNDGQLILGAANKLIFIKNNSILKEITPTYKTKNTSYQIDGIKNIDKLVIDNYNRIWFTSYPDENLYLYQNNSVYDVFDILGIPPTLITSLYKDNQQNLWIGTFNDGVYFIQNTFFNNINFSFNSKNLAINQVCLQKGLLLAATSNGLYGLNLQTYESSVLSFPDAFGEPINTILSNNNVFYYSKRSEFNKKKTSLNYENKTYSINPIIAKLFYPINKEQSIIASWDATILLSNVDGTKITDTLISFPDYKITVNALLKHENLLYIGTNNGLFIYDFKTRTYKNIIRNELNFSINDIALIDNKIYVAHEAGITDLYKRKLIQQIGKFNLSTVKKIKAFQNQIWLATLNGVLICNFNLEPIKILNKSNGLLSNSINDISFNNQFVSIASARGVATSLINNTNQFTTKLKPITIKEIISNGEQLVFKNNSYRLQSTQDNVTIYFYSPLFNKPNKQFFRYKLNKQNWQYIENPSLSITLLGGVHTIELSASADNIEWSDTTRILLIKKEKLTEKQIVYWLITLFSLLLLIIISYIWVRRVKRKGKQRLEEEKQMNVLKHQAMNSLLSPHFIFNSLTSIQNYINTNNSLRASEYLAKFSRLIRMIIEKAAQSDISLYDELARLTYYLELEKERFKNKFDYIINIDDDINTHEVMIPNMIIQPHVENCIIHGILPKQQHGELIISFKRVEKRKFLITIEDNGIGLNKAKENIKAGHKSLGTSTIQNILEINSKLSGKRQKVSMIDKSTLNNNTTGTLITIELEH
jgi:sensor histidine kinase YesM